MNIKHINITFYFLHPLQFVLFIKLLLFRIATLSIHLKVIVAKWERKKCETFELFPGLEIVLKNDNGIVKDHGGEKVENNSNYTVLKKSKKFFYIVKSQEWDYYEQLVKGKKPCAHLKHKIEIKHKDKFQAAYGITCYSCQGKSISTPFTIFEPFEKFTDKNWFWTAVTRATKLSNITICTQYFNTAKNLYQVIKRRIEQHRQEDSVKNRTFNLDYPYIKQMLNNKFKTGFRCPISGCGRYLDVLPGDRHTNKAAWSIDRLDSAVGHVKGNVQIICHHCNVSKGDGTKDKK